MLMTLFSTTPAAAFLCRFFPPLLLTEFLAMVLNFFSYKIFLKNHNSNTCQQRQKMRGKKKKEAEIGRSNWFPRKQKCH
jgi:cytochrome b subunit of formate dehydrogenase